VANFLKFILIFPGNFQKYVTELYSLYMSNYNYMFPTPALQRDAVT